MERRCAFGDNTIEPQCYFYKVSREVAAAGVDNSMLASFIGEKKYSSVMAKSGDTLIILRSVGVISHLLNGSANGLSFPGAEKTSSTGRGSVTLCLCLRISKQIFRKQIAAFSARRHKLGRYTGLLTDCVRLPGIQGRDAAVFPPSGCKSRPKRMHHHQWKNHNAVLIESESWTRQAMHESFEQLRKGADRVISKLNKKAESGMGRPSDQYKEYQLLYREEWNLPGFGIVKERI